MAMDGTDCQGLVALLQDAAPDLERLQRLADERRGAQVAVPSVIGPSAQLSVLRDFADNSTALASLKEMTTAELAELNPFEVLGIQYTEDVHSRFLKWLLDPGADHGLGKYFVEGFLLRTDLSANDMGLPSGVPTEISPDDWTKTEVRREWRNIDILILNGQARFVCAVENKIRSLEGIDENGVSQLTRYRETLESEFASFRRHYVFLSPTGIAPQTGTEREHWIPETYVTVHSLVNQMLEDVDCQMSGLVRAFLTQYETTLRRNIVPETGEVAKMARQMYLQHRKAVKLMQKHKPRYSVETQGMFKKAIDARTDWSFDRNEGQWVHFTPQDLECFESLTTGTWRSEVWPVLLFMFNCGAETDDERGYFQLELLEGTDSGIRKAIIDAVNEHPTLFTYVNGQGSVEGVNIEYSESGWILADRDFILDGEDHGVGWDDGTTEDKVMEWVAHFAEHELAPMVDVIRRCVEEHEGSSVRRRRRR